MYTLYGFNGSGSAAIEIALRRCAVDYRVVAAASWEPSPALDALERVNPLGQIPTLVLPDGSIMTESAAILISLGLAHPDSALLPADDRQRDQVIRGLVYIPANCYSAIGIIDFPQRYCSDASEAVCVSIRAGSRDRLHLLWDRFADQFGPLLFAMPPNGLAILAAVVSRWAGARAYSVDAPGVL